MRAKKQEHAAWKLSDKEVLRIREAARSFLADHMSITAVAEKLGRRYEVSRGTIFNVLYGRSHRGLGRLIDRRRGIAVREPALPPLQLSWPNYEELPLGA